jgi:CRP/FNR family transcriptional regulator, polysaccharide utilization system transcription regulator
MKQFDHVHCEQCLQRHSSIFCNTDHEVLADLSDSKSCTVYKKGDTLFREGGHPFGVYCINAGKIKLSLTGEEGKEQIVRLAKPGDVLGYRAALSGERYAATAVALENSNVCFIPKEQFLKALKGDGNLSFETMKLLSHQLREADLKIAQLAQKPVRERLAECLLFLKETYGFEPETNCIAVQLSREDISSLVGTATETAIRLLGEFNREGIIELQGKKIKIQNLRALTQMANIIV